MDGHVVHQWNYLGFPSGLLDPALTGGKLGHVVLQLSAIEGKETSGAPGRPALFRNQSMGELDWDGKLV